MGYDYNWDEFVDKVNQVLDQRGLPLLSEEEKDESVKQFESPISLSAKVFLNSIETGVI